MDQIILPDSPDSQDSELPADDALARRLAWLLAVLYAVCIGLAVPQGMQMLCFGLLLFPILHLLAVRCGGPDRRLTALGIAAVVNTTAFVFTSNYRILILNKLVFVFTVSIFLIYLYTQGRIPDTPRQYFISLLCCLGKTLENLFYPSNLKSWCGVHFKRPASQDGCIRTRSLVPFQISVLLLLVFNYLFSKVNSEYHDFVTMVFQQVWDVLVYLYELGIITICWQSVLMAFIFYLFFTSWLPRENTGKAKPIPFHLLRAGLISSVVIFAVFSSFQGKLLLAGVDDFTYKALALYVQKGFWELLVAAGIGAIFWDICARSIFAQQAGSSRARRLLMIFTIELLILSFFSQHKLIVQQIAFGFRDKRVFATCGVLLISMTFLLFFGQLLGRIGQQRIFPIQYWSLIAIVLILSLGNLELFSTRFNPIRFNHSGKIYKDYAYLLTNSYDNNAAWLELMDEAERTGIPVPKDYYWGVYTPLCSRKCGGRNRPPNGIQVMRTHFANDYAKRSGLRDVLRFNLREYQAYKVFTKNEERIDRFIRFVDSECYCS